MLYACDESDSKEIRSIAPNIHVTMRARNSTLSNVANQLLEACPPDLFQREVLGHEIPLKYLRRSEAYKNRSKKNRPKSTLSLKAHSQ